MNSTDPTPSNAPEPTPAETELRQPFEEPRLDFIEPKLTPRGDLCEVTGFFGGFSP